MQSTEANGHIKGQFLTPETFVTVRWAWLAFLATQIGLTYVFLLVVIVNTAKLDVQIVKSSNIAELFAISGSGTEGNSISASTYSPRWMGFQPRVDGTLNGKLKKDGENGWNLDVRHEQPRNSRPEPEG